MRRVDANKSTTALRALRVMEILGSTRKSLPVAAVAKSLGADRSTAYRMLMTLVDAGYVDRDDSGKNYRLSFKLLSLGKYLLDGEDEKSRKIMECLKQISAETLETAHYCVLDQLETILVLRSKGTQLVAVDFRIGDRSPLHCTSIGKALLAFQDVRLVEQVIEHGLTRMADRTITDPRQFRAELQRVRAQGYAYDELEFANDMRCVAVPVFEEGGIVRGGISISGPSSRFTLKRLEELRKHLTEKARLLSHELGGMRWDAGRRLAASGR
jgi:DNA-binding IclR family transcriptional regulator